MKRTIIPIICVLLITAIAASVFFCGKKTELNLTFHGIQIVNDSNTQQACSFDLRTTKIEYLFRNSHYKDLILYIPGFETIRRETVDYTTFPEAPIDYISFPTYIPNEHTSITVFLSLDEQWCIIRVGAANEDAAYYVGSVNENSDPSQVWEKWGHLCG